MATTAALILAAGRGTRMRSAQPKVLHRLGGRPMLDHVLQTAGVVTDRTLVVVAPDASDVQRLATERGAVPVTQHEQRGTGDAVRCALDAVEAVDRLVVLCGDTPLLTPETLQRLLDQVPAGEVGLVTAQVARPDGLGRILRDEAGQVLAIIEERDASPAQRAIKEINAGIYVFPRARLPSWLHALSPDNAQGELYLTDVIGLAVREGLAIHAVTATDETEILGVNDRQQLALLERAFQRRQARELMAAGVTLLDPHRFDLRGELRAGLDCVIDVGCVFEGDVALGDGVEIGAHCVIRDARIGDQVRIAPFTHIEGAEIGTGAQVGPFARLREGTRLGAQSRIGNFVETKQTRLGARSKANHLAYLGNASLGDDCNVGAGTITCNYDGVAKHPTEIGDGVFIGSNSTLVAPLKLGPGAYVAAGSTVTTNVPGQALAVGRSRQRNIDHWTPPAKRASSED
ncbi:MAG: bifunctional UDP-N-acetylglucosamine diphosphorylase/glucosamine-1-phosphate N-acetyltransferase GlmU [Pseudomonadales bacterium]|nr:bifunctional UDP-N-acetylglucosamine diphosphorylase/glucosamine-1-phosphate N-acetyltransferase GlmU [Pseudomonadales bacterium]